VKKYTADFETTTDPIDCRVWAWGICDIENDINFVYGNNIETFLAWLEYSENSTFFFHNLKFDGEFILYYLLTHGFTYCKNARNLKHKQFSCLISDMNVFYSIDICFYSDERTSRKCKILDSLKLLPFPVSDIAMYFNLPIEKLKINYNAVRSNGHKLTTEEISYLRNDCTIVAKALKIQFDQDLTKMTIGSNALTSYKKSIGKKNFDRWYPAPLYDKEIRDSYRGGFTYLNPKYQGIEVKSGISLDTNSLYPWVMYVKKLPFGEEIYFEGEYKYDKIYNLYVQTFRCQFQLKNDRIPTVQIKGNLAFTPTQYLTNSKDKDGVDEEISLCMTSIDLKLFFEQYDVWNVEYLYGFKFMSCTGLFKSYIDYWIGVKNQATIDKNYGLRTLAKLMLNSLYGKFSLNPNVQSRIPYLDESETVKYRLDEKEVRKPIFIPIGTFITSYARENTIRAAQTVYDRFMYADTDSLYLEDTVLPENLKIDKVGLGAWKWEKIFTKAKFLQPKRYMVFGHDPYEDKPNKWYITCAGLPKNNHKKVTLSNFKPESIYKNARLTPKHVKGGIVLENASFTFRKLC